MPPPMFNLYPFIFFVFFSEDLEKAKEVLLDSKISMQAKVEELESSLASMEEETTSVMEEAGRKLQDARKDADRQKELLVRESNR